MSLPTPVRIVGWACLCWVLISGIAGAFIALNHFAPEPFATMGSVAMGVGVVVALVALVASFIYAFEADA
jgi:hypothetical protein